MPMRLLAQLVALLAAMPLSAFDPPDAPLQPDAHTRLLVPFDGAVSPLFSSGSSRVAGNGTLIEDGRFGGALSLAPGQRVSFAAANGSLPAGPGTLEFWIRPSWPGDNGQVQSVMSVSGADGNYINVNKLANGRFGVALANQPAGEEIQYARVDADLTDRADWAGRWHHVAATWDTKLTLFIDGEQVDQEDEAPWPQILPQTIDLRGGEQAIDDFRISDVVRYGEEAPAMATPAGVTWLSDLEPASFEGYTKLGRDQRWTTDERPILLAGGGRLYGRGLGMHAPSTAVYDLGGRFARLRARLALSDFAAAGGSVEFRVSADGAEIYHSPLVTHETEPIELDLDISGVQQLTLEALSGPDGVSGDHANWLDAALLAPGAEAPASSIGAPSGVGVDEAERPHLVEPDGVYQFGFDIDGGDAGMALVPKVWMDDYDPAAAPTAAPGSPVALAAARGETEPATALVFATRAQPGASVAVSDLRGPGGAVLPADRVTVRRVVRAPERRIYTTTADDTEITARFLPRWEPQDIGAGEFREIWLAVDVPADAAPGDYAGELAVVSEGRRTALPLALTVYPFELDAPSDKQLGSYYRMAARLQQTEVLAAELADLRAHGIDNLVTDLGIGFRRDGDAVEPDYAELRRGLDLIRDSGLRGTVIVHDDLTTLAALLGIPRDEWDERLTQHEPFMAAAKTAIEGFLAVGAEYPELDLAVTHLDEVFNRDRLPTYLAMAAAVRQVPEAKLYVTFHTVNEEADAMRAQVDPFVDIRCNHGYSFELWLSRGHTMAEYEQELEAAGDVAWIYHNNRGTWFTAEWSRIINGLYLWASPFSVSAPWTYHSSHGNPYDDTDGGDRAHDFGLAFPSLTDDPADLVPTRDYEAMREGGHDLRYLATLERLVNERAADRPEAAAAGRALLARLRALVRDVTVQPADEAAVAEADAGMGAQIDLDTGLVMRTGNIGTQYEAPVINALAERFSGSQWQAIRREVAAAIAGLQ